VRKDNLKVAERRIICKYIAFIMTWIIHGGSICCCQTNIVRFLCVSSARRGASSLSLRATRNTARRFSHAPVCPRLGHPPPSCSATPERYSLEMHWIFNVIGTFNWWKINSELMDVFWRLEVPIEKHYSSLITFFRHLFCKCNVSFTGEGAKPPLQTPPPYLIV